MGLWSWKLLVGDWNGDGAAGVGLRSPLDAKFYLTNDLRTGAVDHLFTYGVDGGFGPDRIDWVPLVGHWKAAGA